MGSNTKGTKRNQRFFPFEVKNELFNTNEQDILVRSPSKISVIMICCHWYRLFL